LEGQTFEAAQYDRLAGLVAALMRRYPIGHLAGHEHVAPGRKCDPGPGFDWQLLRDSLGLETQYFPASAA
jgi:AmpD protein